MATQRRSKPLTPAVAPLTPMSSAGTLPAQSTRIANLESELRWFKNILAQERRATSLKERVLTKHIESQERLISEMKELYVQRINVPVGEAR